MPVVPPCHQHRAPSATIQARPCLALVRAVLAQWSQTSTRSLMPTLRSRDASIRVPLCSGIEGSEIPLTTNDCGLTLTMDPPYRRCVSRSRSPAAAGCLLRTRAISPATTSTSCRQGLLAVAVIYLVASPLLGAQIDTETLHAASTMFGSRLFLARYSNYQISLRCFVFVCSSLNYLHVPDHSRGMQMYKYFSGLRLRWCLLPN